MNIHTGKKITHHHVEQQPYSNSAIKAVEALAHKQGFKDLKFSNQHGVLLHPSNWLAGVDYNTRTPEENDEDYEDNKEYNATQEPEQDIELPEEALDEANEYDPIDQSEIDDLLAHEANPIIPDGDDNMKMIMKKKTSMMRMIIMNKI